MFRLVLVAIALVLPRGSCAMLSEGYRIQSPCLPATAKILADSCQLADDDVHWVAIMPGIKPLQTAMFTLRKIK